jgi:membrane protease YdiL (CAAX protease family)
MPAQPHAIDRPTNAVADAIASAGGYGTIGDTGRGGTLRPILTLFAAMAAAILILLLAQLGMPVIGASSGVAALGPATVEALFTLAMFGGLLAVALVGLRLDAPRRGLAGQQPLAMAGFGLSVGLFGLITTASLAEMAAGVRPGSGPPAGGVAILVGTATILFQASVEEVYFRGWLQPILIRRWGVTAGLIVAALAFAGLHLAGGARSPLTLVNLLLGGILFGLLALRTRGLAAPAAAHAAWNWSEQILLGLDPNPGVGSFGAMFDLDLVGTQLWGGSAEGLNASVALTFVMAALIVPLAAWRRERQPGPIAPARPG